MKKDEKLVLWTERLKTFQASGQTCKECTGCVMDYPWIPRVHLRRGIRKLSCKYRFCQFAKRRKMQEISAYFLCPQDMIFLEKISLVWYTLYR